MTTPDLFLPYIRHTYKRQYLYNHIELDGTDLLGMLRTARARDRLHEMIGDPHPKVRRAAERAYEVLAAKLNA